MEIYEKALYRGKLRVHIVGYRPSITLETMWFVISDGVDVYYKRFYIEHGFKDLKFRFNFHMAMVRSIRILERLIALSSPSSGRVASSQRGMPTDTVQSLFSSDSPTGFPQINDESF